MTKYILNNFYTLRHDKERVLVYSNDRFGIENKVNVNTEWLSPIHPVYAMMLSFFSEPKTLDEGCGEIAEFMGEDKDTICAFITKLIEEKEPSHTNLGGEESGFPVNMLIEEKDESYPRKTYTPEQFAFVRTDLARRRNFTAPNSIVLMPNNTCYTSCRYCYADTRTGHHRMPIEYIRKLAENAREAGVREILITGGDFFLCHDWREILNILNVNGFPPNFISTKKPLSEEEVADIARAGIYIQFSFDTVDAEVAADLVGTPRDYVEKVKETLRLFDKHGVSYHVASVITRMNAPIAQLEGMREFLSTLKNIRKWDVRIAFRSLYSKDDFDNIKATRKQIGDIAEWIEKVKEDTPFDISWVPDDDDKYKKAEGGSKNFEGAACSANVSNMMVLPDGNVTICEQLYWHPDFIIGNIKDNTIEEIWNSPRALALWNLRQEAINPKSPCHKCKDFDDCFKTANRCYANILKAYGADNSDFPDPRCKYAPPFARNLTHE